MKTLQNIDTKKIVAIDIETVRIVKDYALLSDEWKTAWKNRMKKDGEAPTEEQLAEMWPKQASLYAEFSKVCAVSIVFFGKGSLRCKQLVSEHELPILEELAVVLNSFGKDPEYRIAAHAGKYFDYPYLCKRYIINNMRIPSILDESDSKPWEMKLLCTNDLWKSFGTGLGSPLQPLCVALGIESSKTDLVGDEVGDSFYKGEYLRIAKYCNQDTIAVFNLVRRFKGESTFLFKDVICVNEEEVLVNIPILTKIFETKKFTASQLKTIQSATADYSDEHRKIVRDLVTAALIEKGVGLKAEFVKLIGQI
jgi:hypothetical protein